MKKKIILMFTFLFGIFCLVSCGGNENNTDNGNTDTGGNTEPGGNGDTNGEVESEYKKYSIKVVYENGTAATSSTGIKAQLCTVEACEIPVAINDNGVAEMDLIDKEYHVHLTKIPTGYTYNPNLYVANADNRNVEVTLYAINEPTGEGTQDNPYIATLGAYQVECDAALDKSFFSFTPTTSGTYVFESLVQEIQSSVKLNPVLVDMTTNTQTDAGENVNFKYSFTATANTTYIFVATLASNTKTTFPASFNFLISKA